jgi:hypothetical protein
MGPWFLMRQDFTAIVDLCQLSCAKYSTKRQNRLRPDKKLCLKRFCSTNKGFNYINVFFYNLLHFQLEYNGSLGIAVVKGIRGGILRAPHAKYPHGY